MESEDAIFFNIFSVFVKTSFEVSEEVFSFCSVLVSVFNCFFSLNFLTDSFISYVTSSKKPDSTIKIIGSNTKITKRHTIATITNLSSVSESSSVIVSSVSSTTVSAGSFSIDSDTTSSQTVTESFCALSSVSAIIEIGIIMIAPTVAKHKILIHKASLSRKNANEYQYN